MAPRYLAILFDIDGTLIVTGGDGVASWRMDLDTRYDPEGTHSAGVAGGDFVVGGALAFGASCSISIRSRRSINRSLPSLRPRRAVISVTSALAMVSLRRHLRFRHRRAAAAAARAQRLQPFAKLIEIEKDDWRSVERQRLADDEPADHGIAERLAQL